jgi:hypothetical protein
MKLNLTNDAGTLIASRDITTGEQSALLYELAGEDGIAQWLLGALAGKIDHCQTAMADQAIALLRSGSLKLAAIADLTAPALAAALVAQPAYKDRAARDAGEATRLAATLDAASITR